MVRFFSLALGATLVGLLVLLIGFKVELALVATLGMGTVCLAWLLAVLVLPWNLYFRARHLLAEMDRSEKRRIPVDPDARLDARALEKRMLCFSLGLHFVSAALLALGAWLFGQRLGYAFSALFLLSTLLRPAAEYYQYLQAKLSGYLDEVKYPREDVRKLVADVRRLEEESRAHREGLEQAARGQAELAQAVESGDQSNRQRLEQVARRFEETIDKLTDNREIISGIKAFLRLVQAP
jgi:CRISPR/Cas system CSM-associated protein Csm2 small subunit